MSDLSAIRRYFDWRAQWRERGLGQRWISRLDVDERTSDQRRSTVAGLQLQWNYREAVVWRAVPVAGGYREDTIAALKFGTDFGGI